MTKTNKNIIIGIIISLIVLIFIILIYNVLTDENKLTVEEKQWINDNLSTVQNINVINDINIYGKNGHGVFYDFISDFSSEYDLKINPITNNRESSNNIFKDTYELTDNSLIFDTDHFVLVSKTDENIKRDDIYSKKVGILTEDLEYVKKFISKEDFITYNTKEDLINALNNDVDINYILVPRSEYIDIILVNGYFINYHYSDIKIYFVYEMDKNNTLSNIVKKYYQRWKDDYLTSSKNENSFIDFSESLNLSDQDINDLSKEVYNYGFINNSPYEILISGNYGGIVGEYIKQFSEFSEVEFNFTKYKNTANFLKSLNKGKIDLYFNYYNIDADYISVNTHMNIKYEIIAPINNDLTVDSLNSLMNQTVYILKDSPIINDFKKINNIDIVTVDNIKELIKCAKDNRVIIIDTETYQYYVKDELANYTSRYIYNSDYSYQFKIKDDTVFAKLFAKYINYLDPAYILNVGLYNHELTLKNGTIFGTIAKYSLLIIICSIIILYLLYRKGKRIKISKKIKKEDKMRYIDQLTSLKNRNYLTENLDNWNKNTIYPQTTIIIDLNKIQEINDTLGYEEGDNQIKAAANILIKTQLDNSEIIRTSGNEFLIYLVEYPEKQIVSYIRKLNKELKNLPHDYGATIGYSMILDDKIMIEDAINEAVDKMKAKKIETYEE